MRGMVLPRLFLPVALACVLACGDDANDDGVAATSAASTTSTSPATADDATTAEPAACGDTCKLNEVCVVSCPCPPPGTCFQRPAIGDCGQGTYDVGGTTCCASAPDPQACMELEWCIHGSCTPDPPACVPEADVTCAGDECSVDDGCSGRREDDVLTCQVCP